MDGYPKSCKKGCSRFKNETPSTQLTRDDHVVTQTFARDVKLFAEKGMLADVIRGDVGQSENRPRQARWYTKGSSTFWRLESNFENIRSCLLSIFLPKIRGYAGADEI